MRANWDRLDSRRSASKIARSLLALSRPAVDGTAASAPVRLDALERRVFGVPVLEPLEQLRSLVARIAFAAAGHERVLDVVERGMGAAAQPGEHAGVMRDCNRIRGRQRLPLFPHLPQHRDGVFHRDVVRAAVNRRA